MCTIISKLKEKKSKRAKEKFIVTHKTHICKQNSWNNHRNAFFFSFNKTGKSWGVWGKCKFLSRPFFSSSSPLKKKCLHFMRSWDNYPQTTMKYRRIYLRFSRSSINAAIMNVFFLISCVFFAFSSNEKFETKRKYNFCLEIFRRRRKTLIACIQHNSTILCVFRLR